MKKIFAFCALALPLANAVAAPKSPTVMPVSAAQLKKDIAARKGKIVMVNFWATYCPPCKNEFPALLQLQKKYAARGVSLLIVSADDMRDLNPKVRPFLRAMKVANPTRITAGNPIRFVGEFDPNLKTDFALPRFYIYNRSGKLVKSFSNPNATTDTKANLLHFESVIKPLL